MIKKQSIFWSIYTIFFVIGLVAIFVIDKGDFIVFFSENRNGFFDKFFQFMSFIVEAHVFIALALILAIYNYRGTILIGAVGLVTLVVSSLLKFIFAEPRPLLYFENIGKLDTINLVEGYSAHIGLTSFPSGHTMAAFAIFLALAIILKRKYVDFIMICLALLVGLSRIYLVNHFLEDVLAGSILGLLITLGLNWTLDRLKIPEGQSVMRIFDKKV